MSVFKCKMCGGTLEINGGESVATCDYCGTKQTLPRLDDERKANMYDRANHFRRNNEFDKAMGIYEQILNEDSSDAEAYWSLVLCRFGIEYVEDPATHKRVPTINRAQYTSVFDDDNYKSALNYADSLQKAVYEQEARAINEIQKGILEISQKEEPFDVFVCYKETDNNGRRTPDSVLANDLYHQLTQEGFKVFFARITLEDKLGSAYEPYIFAALNSAKVMVVLGTKPEYFSAVWVKNEWSRYLSLIKQGEKKILIPAYKDMDPYDLPEEFSHLQAQDMSKLGFMQDLIRGIKKITQTDAPKETVVRETVTVSAPVNNNIAPLLKRAAMFLEDKNWQSANEYCQKVLDMDPECATAYLYLLLAELEVSTVDELEKVIDENGIAGRDNYKKAIRFGDAELKERLEYLNKAIIYNKAESHYKRATTAENYKTAKAVYAKISDFRDSSEKIKLCEGKVLQWLYDEAQRAFDKANSEQHYLEVAEKFQAIKDYKDSAEKIKLCKEKAIEATYSNAKRLMNKGGTDNYLEAIKGFKQVLDYKDSKELIEWCEEDIKDLEEEQRNRIKKAKIITFLIVALVIFVILWVNVFSPMIKYNNAVSLMENREYPEAISVFEELGDYKDSKDMISECNYLLILSYIENQEYGKAASVIESIGYDNDLGGKKELVGAILDVSRMKESAVGEYVTFGEYKQDAGWDKSKEKLKWEVLAIEEDKMLLVTKYVIDSGREYEQMDELLQEMLSSIFNDFEQDFISDVAFIDEMQWSKPCDNSGKKLFLLSEAEVEKYDLSKCCKCTIYGKAQGVSVDVFGYVSWLLRDVEGNSMSCVTNNGDIESSYTSNGQAYGVRPAMWIDLSKVK